MIEHFLARHDLTFESFHWGAHIVAWEFGREEKKVDIYPQQKLLKARNTGEKISGVKNLLIYLKGEKYVNSITKSQ